MVFIPMDGSKYSLYGIENSGLTFDGKLAAREVNEAGVSGPLGEFDLVGYHSQREL